MALFESVVEKEKEAAEEKEVPSIEELNLN